MSYRLAILLLFLSFQVHSQTGIIWDMSFDVASSSSGNEHPRIVTDRSGNPLVIWHHASRAMFSRWNGAGFTTPVLLNPPSISVAGATWMGPDIASYGDTIYAVFKQTPEASDTCHIFCVRSFDGGVTFSSPVQVDFINDSLSRFPTITTDALGNPIVGFMKFNSSFSEARWVVSRSVDYGSSFSVDVKASGWSDPNSTVCDCCPGSITSSGSTVVMLYRDNNSNIRDSWAGISNDNGSTFLSGMNADNQNWTVFACPATGPDGVIIGDTLYSAFLNGADGSSKVYWSRASITSVTGATGEKLAGTVPGLTMQNYPRIAASGKALGVVWNQAVSGVDQCVLRFAADIDSGLAVDYDTVDLGNVMNSDIAIANGKVYIVWEDDAGGVIKFRSGSYTPVTTSVYENSETPSRIFPIPASTELNIEIKNNEFSVSVYDLLGTEIYRQKEVLEKARINTEAYLNGLYFILVTLKTGEIRSSKVIISHD
jgi:hypothetical protein